MANKPLAFSITIELLATALAVAGELPGFPLRLGGSTFAPVVVADITGDGKHEIAVAVNNDATEIEPAKGALYLVGASGAPLPGWPVCFAQQLGGIRIAAGDMIPGNRGAELAVGTRGGKVHLLASDGSEAPGFPVEAGAFCTRCFIADLGNDGQRELIAIAPAGKILVLDGTGKSLPGWPKTVEAGLHGDCEVVDLDGDGFREIVVLDKRGVLHVFRGADVSPVNISLRAAAFCTGDFLPDVPGLELLVTDQTAGTATLCDRTGKAFPGWPVKIPQACLPTGVTLTKSGRLHALVVEQAQHKPKRTLNTIHILTPDGKPAPGWPLTPRFVPGYPFASRPVVSDVDGDGQNEIFFGHTCYAVAGFRADGSDMPGFPLRNVGMVYGRPSLVDLNGDRRYELIFADASSIKSLHAFPLPYEFVPQLVHTPTEAETRRGFVLTEATPFDTILPDSPAFETKLLNRIEIMACAGEFEPGSFVVHALRDLDIALGPADLVLYRRGTGTPRRRRDVDRIPAANMDVRFVHVWRQRKPDGSGAHKVPELLLKRDPGVMKGIISQPLTPEVKTHVPAGTARQFWITVKAPSDARSGAYEGRLSFKANGIGYTVGCRLRVLPLKLPPDPFIHSIYFHGSSVGLGWYGEKDMSREAYLEAARRQLADLRAHGLNGASTYAPAIITTKGDGYTFGLKNLRRSLLLHKEAGLTKWTVVSLGYSRLDGKQLHPRLGASFYKAFTALVREVEKMARDGGLPPISYYGVDEPTDKSKQAALKYYGFENPIDVCRRWFEAIRAGGGWSASAVYRTKVGGWPVLGPLCDVPIFSLGSIYPACSHDEVAGEVAARPTRQAWYYWQCWKEKPIESRLLAGFYLCKSGLTGVMPWAYMAYARDPYDDADGGHKDFCIAYPSREGPVPTLSWEAFREGVDDCRYYAAVKGRAGSEKILEALSFSNSHNCATLTADDLQNMRRKLVALALGR